MVFTQSMNTIKDTILTLAGGEMSTDTLNLIAVLFAFLFLVLVAVGITYALNMHKVKDNRPKAPITIHGAQ